MTFEGAVIREQGVTFAIVVVKESALSTLSSAGELINSFRPLFPQLPIVLMAQDWRGTPKYVGRTDIVRFLASIHPSRIPWKKYNYS